MVKTYLKYELKEVLGQITGKSCKVISSPDGKFLYAGCNEWVIVLNIKTGEVHYKFTSIKSEVTCLCIDRNNTYLAVGYNNGTITVHDIINSYAQSKKFALHKSAIVSMDFNKALNLLASGSKDTNIFIWDMIGDNVLYKLSGHKDGISRVMFYPVQLQYEDMEILVTAAKDNQIKVWNIKNQTCIQTLADLVHKVNDFILYDDILLLGSYDQKLRIYSFDATTILDPSPNLFTLKGTIMRGSKNKIISMNLTPDEKMFSILSNDQSIEFFKILSDSEVKRRLILNQISGNKNQKREKLVQKENFEEVNEQIEALVKKDDYNYKYKYYSLFKFLGENKILSLFYVKSTNSNFWHFGIGLNNNSIELYDLYTSMIEQTLYQKKNFQIEERKINESNLSVEKKFSIESYGHRDVLRYVKFNERDTMFITCSNDSVKLWNALTLNYIKGLGIENAMTGIFICDDKYIVLCTKKGDLYLINSNSFTIIQKIPKAHDSEIWSVHPLKFSYVSKRYKIVTCSSDKSVKYWNINPESSEEIITEYKKIETLDQITYCMISPDGKYLVYSLLDNSIRIFYEDTKKFFLNLYGHKMPVLSFDISSDNTLLISGSADKNIKIWGMDFGDCHKSLFAHQDSVTSVKFVPKTHYFFSSSKDRAVRYWDADTFELIMEFNDFFGEIWSLDINSPGTNLVAVSADCSIKLYQITQEQAVPELEKEKKLDKYIEEEMQKEFEAKNSNVNELNKEIDQIVPIKKTMDNIGFAEDLMESLDIAEKFKSEVYQYEIAAEEYHKSLDQLKSNSKEKLKPYNLQEPEMPSPPLLLLGKHIFDFILFKLKSIRHSELENTLNNIPYSYFQTLLFYLEYYIRNNIEIELCARCMIFFVTLFESQMSNDKTIIRLLDSISMNLKQNLKRSTDILSFNIQTIDFILRCNEMRQKSIEEFKQNKLNKLKEII